MCNERATTGLSVLNPLPSLPITSDEVFNHSAALKYRENYLGRSRVMVVITTGSISAVALSCHAITLMTVSFHQIAQS